jgi:23S rRNA (pseudouridine1915-N3)-methyltransferase
MHITIITVGKLKGKYLKQGIAEYTKRLGAYCSIQEIEVADEKAPEQLSEAEMARVKKKEGERISAKIGPDVHVLADDISTSIDEDDPL